jgi:hypothetical protein
MPPDYIGRHRAGCRALTNEMTSKAELRDNFLMQMEEHDIHSIKMEIPEVGGDSDCSVST